MLANTASECHHISLSPSVVNTHSSRAIVRVQPSTVQIDIANPRASASHSLNFALGTVSKDWAKHLELNYPAEQSSQPIPCFHNLQSHYLSSLTLPVHTHLSEEQSIHIHLWGEREHHDSRPFPSFHNLQTHNPSPSPCPHIQQPREYFMSQSLMALQRLSQILWALILTHPSHVCN